MKMQMCSRIAPIGLSIRAMGPHVHNDPLTDPLKPFR